MPGRLFVVSGPAGAGKGTILSRALQERPDIRCSVSATTRQPRVNEVDGVHYYFLTDEQFQERVDNDGFLEWANVHGNRYGTPRSEVESKLEEGSLVLEIDPQGAANVRKAMPSCVLVFIAPPSIEVLRERLVGRGSESAESLERRLSDAIGELERQAEYDEVIVNDDLETAVREILALFQKYES